MSPEVSVVIPTHDRKDDLCSAIDSVLKQTFDPVEVVVVCDSDDDTPELFNDGARYDQADVRFFGFDEPLGIAEALNRGNDAATGDVVVTLDDDSMLESADALSRIVECFEDDPDLGLLALRTENYYNSEEEFPRQKTEPSGLEAMVPWVRPMVDLPTGRSDDGPITTTYFPGCGYAVRGAVFDEIESHPSEFVYAAYEDDLAFRVMDAGYTIKYLPSVTALHKRSPSRNVPTNERLLMMLENRLAVALRHLPWRNVVLVFVLWTGGVLYRTGFDIRGVLSALRNIVERRENYLDERSTLDSDTIEYIEQHGGRLY